MKYLCAVILLIFSAVNARVASADIEGIQVRASYAHDLGGNWRRTEVWSFAVEFPLWREAFAHKVEDKPEKTIPVNNYFDFVFGLDDLPFIWTGVRFGHEAYEGYGFSLFFGFGMGDRGVYNDLGSYHLFRFGIEAILHNCSVGWTHWSNAGTGWRNPGLDVLFLGLRFH